MEDSIFSKIIRREIPSDIVYEDEHTIAILDIAPSNPGHTLVIPKSPVRDVFEVDPETWARVFETVRKLAPAVTNAVSADGVNIHANNKTAAGQVVFHLHVHIIPRFAGDGLSLFPHKKYQEGEAAHIAEKIRSTLSVQHS